MRTPIVHESGNSSTFDMESTDSGHALGPSNQYQINVLSLDYAAMKSKVSIYSFLVANFLIICKEK